MFFWEVQYRHRVAISDGFSCLQELPEGMPGRTGRVPRRVFVASDDPQLLAEARRKYPDYEFLGDSGRAQSASLSSRYTHSALLDVVADVVGLSHCDFVVCTFSSQVCFA